VIELAMALILEGKPTAKDASSSLRDQDDLILRWGTPNGGVVAGETELAIRYYERSIELNPNKLNGKEMLSGLKKG
jgi:hypothetical protein